MSNKSKPTVFSASNIILDHVIKMSPEEQTDLAISLLALQESAAGEEVEWLGHGISPQSNGTIRGVANLVLANGAKCRAERTIATDEADNLDHAIQRARDYHAGALDAFKEVARNGGAKTTRILTRVPSTGGIRPTEDVYAGGAE